MAPEQLMLRRARNRGRHAAPAQARRFLPEVQALRALAVGVVVAYHLYPRSAPGGFVGVDVFFVISGFLITGHLLREVEATGRVSLPRFWAARVRRIMPAALTTVVAVMVATLVLWPPTQWGQIGRQGLASVLSVENWALAADAVDYLASDNQPTALQHFWSLGVEEQFYVLWPFVVLAAAALAAWAVRRSGSRRAHPPVRAWAALLSAAVVVLSLVYATLCVLGGDAAAYFNTFTRVWELAAGGLLAAVLPATGWAASMVVRRLVALAGLATLLAVALLYTAQLPFPGLSAIPPVLGTLAIIAAGRTAGTGSLHRLSDARAVQWLGNVSYSLYLWHWPVVIVFQHLSGRHARWWEALALLALSLLLAQASYVLIERPARTWSFAASHAWRALGVGAAATALVAAVTVVPGVRADAMAAAAQGEASVLEASKPRGFGAQAWDAAEGAAFVSGTAIVPVPAHAGADMQDIGDCFAEVKDRSVKRCSFGEGKKTVALVGDSHAQHWLSAVRILGRDAGWRVETYVKKSCPFTSTPRTLELDGHSVCVAANEKTVEALVRDKPDAVIVASWAGSTFKEDPRPGFRGYLQRLRDAGIKVAVLRDTPLPRLAQEQMPRDCVAAHPDDVQACATPRSTAIPADPQSDAARQVPGVSVVDLNDHFCPGSRCPAVVGNVLVYRDASHISDTYVDTLVPLLRERLPGGVLK